MKTSIKTVVAAPGHQVLLEIAGCKVVVTAFIPLDLSQMFTAKEIEKCAGIVESINNGYLLEYTGQPLPIDPNAQYIAELRQAQAQHIKVGYSQKGSVLNPNTQIVTAPVETTEEFKQNLLDQVERSKTEILSANASLLNRAQGAYEDVDKDPVERKDALTDSELTMKVSMDISTDQFIAKQKEDAARAEEARKDKPLPTEGVSPVAERVNTNPEED